MLNATCYGAGTLVLHTTPHIYAGDETIQANGLADYSYASSEALYKCASSYQWVVRPNGKRVSGSDYSRRQAQNDLDTFSL